MAEHEFEANLLQADLKIKESMIQVIENDLNSLTLSSTVLLLRTLISFE